MTPVSKNDARRICLASDAKLVFQEGYDIYYADFAPESDAEPFLVRGCLAVRTAPHWHIHALNGRSDLPSAITEVRERMMPGEKLMILPLGDAPEEYRGCRGSFKLAREARPYSDPEIRPIVPEDAARIAEYAFRYSAKAARYCIPDATLASMKSLLADREFLLVDRIIRPQIIEPVHFAMIEAFRS